MRRSRGLILVASLAVSTLSACSITFGEARTSEEAPPAMPSASVPQSTDGPAPSISAPGRLAVLESDGSLYTIEADGSDRAELIAAEGEALTALQPAWAPGGERLAWVISELRGGAIVVAGPRGEDPVVTPTPFVPYYLSWSPTGDRVAFLGPGAAPEAPVQMGVLELEGDEPQVRPVAGGEPFLYFAWAPDGRRVLAHAGFDRLEEIDLEGRSTPVTTRPGLFAAPAWSEDGRTLIYAERGPNGVQRLIAVVDEGRPETLVEGDGALSFVMRPDGRAVAYQMLDERDGDLFDRRPTEPGDGVRVIDLRTGAERRATRIRAMTFWWSPNSERLLALAPEPESTDAIPFLWQIWDGRRVIDVPGSHFPTLELMRDYAPFFTQYSQSATPWSPDGSAFAFPVLGPDGSGQIVVQQIGGEPSVIGDGVYVTWSP